MYFLLNMEIFHCYMLVYWRVIDCSLYSTEKLTNSSGASPLHKPSRFEPACIAATGRDVDLRDFSTTGRVVSYWEKQVETTLVLVVLEGQPQVETFKHPLRTARINSLMQKKWSWNATLERVPKLMQRGNRQWMSPFNITPQKKWFTKIITYQ